MPYGGKLNEWQKERYPNTGLESFGHVYETTFRKNIKIYVCDIQYSDWYLTIVNFFFVGLDRTSFKSVNLSFHYHHFIISSMIFLYIARNII